MNRLCRLWRHLWLDASDAERALGSGGLDRLEAAVQASEEMHEGQICLCIEAGLPVSWLWQIVRGRIGIDAAVRQRALAVFGRERVWDTAHNNGVLIYLLLAERRLEVIADRGLAEKIGNTQLQSVAEAGCLELRRGRLEQGFAACLEAVHAQLVEHFPRRRPDAPGSADNLPDRPRLL